MKTMTETTKDEMFPEWVTSEQKVVAEHHLSKGSEIYIEGPYNCSFHKKQYGYVWVINKRLLKLDGRGYDVKMQCETHPRIV